MTITINNQNLEITEEQLETIRTALNLNGKRLADVVIGETFKIGKYEFIVLEKPCGGIRAVILKDSLYKDVRFGDSNNYIKYILHTTYYKVEYDSNSDQLFIPTTEVINEKLEEKKVAKVEAIKNPFRTGGYYGNF